MASGASLLNNPEYVGNLETLNVVSAFFFAGGDNEARVVARPSRDAAVPNVFIIIAT